MSKIELHRLEDYTDPRKAMSAVPYIVCSFETERFGYFQVKYKSREVSELMDEPSIEMFTKSEKNYIWHICAIVFRMVYDAPAATERFEERKVYMA